MPYPSDAQLWIDLKREYPGPDPYEIEIIPEPDPEPVPRMCFTCKIRPAGTPGWYEHSAYCSRCQLELLNRLPQDKPATLKGGEWAEQLAQCRRELEAAVSATGKPLQTGVAADYGGSEGDRLAPVPDPSLPQSGRHAA